VTLNFGYGPERTLVYRERTSGTAFEAKRYLGKLYERIDKSSGAVTHRHNIFGRPTLDCRFRKHSNAPSETLYLHKDHLGSPMAVTDQAGSFVELLSFDAWGQRRQTNWTPATGTDL
jgi:hypothetical protein